jgi:hypothetical protein
VTRRNEQTSPALDAYIDAHSTPPDAILDRVMIADERVEAVLLPLGDGLTLAWKR